MTIARFFFHAELNRFLARGQRGHRFDHPCADQASVKHMIEALGVPHTEVEALAVDGQGADFSHRIRDGECIDVYPQGRPAPMPHPVPLRPPPPSRFVADAHLGQLARDLRMFGFDTVYRNDFSDADVARMASTENRIVLTRDRDLLIRKEIVHGCFLHATCSEEQVVEVLRRFKLRDAVHTFSRCLRCNHELRAVPKAQVAHKVPPHSHAAFESFRECGGCDRVYWEGSHVARMRARLAKVLGDA